MRLFRSSTLVLALASAGGVLLTFAASAPVAVILSDATTDVVADGFLYGAQPSGTTGNAHVPGENAFLRAEQSGRFFPVPPDARVVRDYASDASTDDVASRRGVEKLIYSNIGDPYQLMIYRPPLAQMRIADDICTEALNACALHRYLIRVNGGVPNGWFNTFTTRVALTSYCPSTDYFGPTIPGTELSFTRTADINDIWELEVDFSDANIGICADGRACRFADDAWGSGASCDDGSECVERTEPVVIPSQVWLRVEFSTNTAGWLVGAPPIVGFSTDNYDDMITGCNTWFGGYPDHPHASFYAQFYAPIECVAQGTCSCNGTPHVGEPDCNGNGMPDHCDIRDYVSNDCNANRVPDECDIAGGASEDCNDNGIPDECELRATITIDIEAYIDGRDFLIIRGDTLQWHHLDWAAVGRLNGVNEPTIISTTLNGVPVMDRVPWIPEWPEPPPAEIRYEAWSSVFADLIPAFPAAQMTITLTPIWSRRITRIEQLPDVSNDYTLIVDFNDNAAAGAAWYKALVTVEYSADCNENGIADSCDIADGTSEDCTGNAIPDECEADCNDNGVPDSCDIDLGDSLDCNANGVPDECDIGGGTSADCNGNQIPDDCEWAAYRARTGLRSTADRQSVSLCQLPDQLQHGGLFAAPLDADLGEAAADSFTLTESVRIDTLRWWGTYRDRCDAPCEVADDFEVTFYLNEFGFANTVVGVYSLGDAVQRSLTGQSIPFEGGFDEYEYSAELVPPLSAESGRRYWIEIRNNVASPCVWWWETAPQGATGNSSSLYDAARDGFGANDLTPYDLAFCVSGLPAALDCNANDVDDAQDIIDGTSEDCQPNGVPDECEDDRNYNGVPDTCDIVSGTARDINFNGVPDEADCPTRPGDMDGDCDIDRDDFALFHACLGLSGPDLLGGCACADLDGDATVDMDDYLAYSMQAATVDETCRVTAPDACPDSWVTAGAGAAGRAGLGVTETFYDFGLHGPIPADFFDEGSEKFGEIVTLIGRPVDPNGVYGDIDTQIQHGPVLFDPETGTAQAALDLSTLDLMSLDPITVTYANGKDPEEWLVVAGLSRSDPGSGVLEATLDEPGANAGTFDATVYVQPAFLFVKLQDLVDGLLPECVTMRVLDTGPQPPGRTQGHAEANGETAGVIDPITLSFTGQPFVRVASPSVVEQLSIPACAQGHFVPGVVEPPGGGRAAQELTCTSHITPGEAHYFCPPECEGDDVYLYTELRDGSTPLPGSGPPPPFPRQTLGPIPPSGPSRASDYTARFTHSAGGGGAVKLYGDPTPVTRESTCTGACCDPSSGACTMGTLGLCGADSYQDDGTDCRVMGACRSLDGTCVNTTQFCCGAAGNLLMHLNIDDHANVRQDIFDRLKSALGAPPSPESIVIALGGFTEQPDPTHPDWETFGVFHIAQDLRAEGYDVRMYDEFHVAPGGSGQAYLDVVSAVQNYGVTQVLIFGYSRGGGSTHDLAELLDANWATIGTFDIRFTAYIDAIVNTWVPWDLYDSETDLPPGTQFHVNYYQRIGIPGPLPNQPDLMGDAVPGANLNVNVTEEGWIDTAYQGDGTSCDASSSPP